MSLQEILFFAPEACNAIAETVAAGYGPTSEEDFISAVLATVEMTEIEMLLTESEAAS